MVKRFILFLVLILASTSAYAIPQQINFQGRLTNQYGTPESGSKTMYFTIYSDEGGITSVWGPETQTDVPVTNGLFNVQLGSVTPIPQSVFDGSDRWLGIRVESDSEMTPRHKLTSVGYAYRAATAESVVGAAGGWTTDGSTKTYTNYNVGIGTTEPTERLVLYGNLQLDSGSPTTARTVISHTQQGVGKYAWYVWSNATSLRLFDSSTGNDLINFCAGGNVDIPSGNLGLGLGHYGEPEPANRLSVSGEASIGSGYVTTAAPTNGMIIQGNVGIGTTEPGAKLEVAGSVKITNGSIYSTNWTDVTFGTNWSNFGSPNQTVQYKKVGDLIFLRGTAMGTDWSSYPTIFNLPVGFRPLATLVFAPASSGGMARINILSDGNVNVVTGGGSGFVSLDGVVFSVD